MIELNRTTEQDPVLRCLKEEFHSTLTPNAKIYIMEEEYDEEDTTLFNINGELIPTPNGLGDTFTVFFVDLFPEANWSHKCGYIFLGSDKNVWQSAEWPPTENITHTPALHE